MKIFETFIRKVARLDDAAIDRYEQNVLNASFDVKRVPKTSKYYEAYMIGFLHGAEAAQNKLEGKYTIALHLIIERKKKREQEAAIKAAHVNVGI